MNHIKTFEELAELETNEGFKDFMIGGLLILSSIIPNYILSSNVYNYGGEKIEALSTNTLDKKTLIKTLKQLLKEGFDVTPGDLPIKMQLEGLPEDGDFVLINTAGGTVTGADFMLEQLIKSKGAKKKVIKLFKKGSKAIEAVAVILLK